ncbi:hypothetical protein [Vibrio harveyi]|uniref:hypothetical protein n=1 Tax=Vibrio harveyi TaxID=669 RepID=UPI003D7254F1
MQEKTYYVDGAVIYAIETEIEALKYRRLKLEENAKRNNKDIRFNKAWQDANDQISRLCRALKPLVNQYY